ncbi:MAG: hypothetical protein OER87_18525 [Gammaproteobacteria bacterium]|nr:hypothetical protein [Gammaproteobacteria bacterium]
MFHMLSCFDLKPGEDIAAVQSAYSTFCSEMNGIDLVERVPGRSADARTIHRWIPAMKERRSIS